MALPFLTFLNWPIKPVGSFKTISLVLVNIENHENNFLKKKGYLS